MVGTIVSTVRSFYSPTHYEWAAYERTGIGLSYIFTLAVILCTLLVIGLYLAGFYLGTDFGNYLQDRIRQDSSSLAILSGINNKILIYIIYLMLAALGLP